MSKDQVLIITAEQRRHILENVKYNSETKMERDVATIVEWFEKQQHLPRISLDRRFIENVLISRKGSVEQTKQKIDLMFSIKNVIPDMAAPRDILHPRMQNILKGCTIVTVPKLNNDSTRVIITILTGMPQYFNINDMANYIFTMVEYRMLHDCFAGERHILDFKNLTVSHITKVTPTNIKYAELYIRKAYGVRIFGIHFINAPSLLNTLLEVIKAGLSEKLRSRIYVHNSYDDLYKVIDKDILPAEYGGNEKSSVELLDGWKAELGREEVRNYLTNQEKLCSNEAIRIGGKMNDDILGIGGSFRKLEVD